MYKQDQSWMKWLGMAVVATMLGFGWSNTARAQDDVEYDEPWFFTVSGGVSGALNNPVNGLFGPGGSGGVGVYRAVSPEFAFGGRVSAGALGEGNDIPQEPVDRDVLDYGMIAPALRIRPLASVESDTRRATGLYVDLAPGLALADGHVIPAYTVGAGYNFEAGPIAIGPMARFTHLIETEGRFGDNHIAMVTGGLEVAFLDEATPMLEDRIAATVIIPPGQETNRDIDGDWIVNRRDDCPNVREIYNGLNDTDGCPDAGTGAYVNGALAVNERVFFDFDGAELRQTGIDQLEAVADHYREHADAYARLIVSGHTDVRGTEDYNEDLGQARAEAVRSWLVAHGVPASVIRMRSLGEAAPAEQPADDALDHQINRRVEFRVQWRDGMRPAGQAPETEPTMPEYVDRAEDDEAGEPQAAR